MSCDIAKLINEYELAAKKFRYSESQECFEQKCMTYEAIVKAVASLEAENVALRERTRWIPVGERLPDVYRDEENRELIPFLVCVHEEGYPFRAVYDGKGWGDGAFKIYPTHWMPLPAAPKEDE